VEFAQQILCICRTVHMTPLLSHSSPRVHAPLLLLKGRPLLRPQ